jgi:hypothetical protein
MVDVPELGLRACIETAGRHCVSQIHSAGQQQNLPGWFTLERLLVQKLKSTSINQRHHAVVWLAISFALFGLAAFMISNDLPRLQQAMSSMFDRD